MEIKVGIIGGTGLDDPDILLNRRERIDITPFGNPSDSLIEGDIEGVPCVLLARHGRQHTIMPGNVNYRANIWALKEAGCTHVIVSTLTGSLQELLKPGQIVIPDTFIDRTQGRRQTFYDGEPNSPKGVCHIPMEPAFCDKTRRTILETAQAEGISVHPNGTVVVIEGPRFSSKAESMMFKQWGGHIINMTTVPEVVLAKEAGMCYAAIALVTDYDCWRSTGEVVDVESVYQTFKENSPKILQLIKAVIPKLKAKSWDATVSELRHTVKKSVMKSSE